MTAYRLGSESGLSAVVLDYGATLQALCLPDGQNVTLGYGTLEAYLSGQDYRGAMVGRNANRIIGASFKIGGQTYKIPANEGGNSLHSGPAGFESQMWDACRDGETLVLRHSSPDGHQGFPGAVNAVLRIRINDLSLRMEMQAETTAPTPINLTWHPYFNLNGEGRIDGHDLHVEADHRTRLDQSEPLPVEQTRFDFRQSLPLGSVRLDDNYAGVGKARLRAGRTRLTVESSLPDMQVYTGDGLDVPRSGIALEPQFRPDDINRERKSLLRPGETYDHWIEYKFES